MTHPTPDSQITRLDELTERRIETLVDFAVEHGHPKIKALPEECDGCKTQRNALRSRIRTLLDEARKEGEQNMVRRARAGALL